MVLLNFIPLNLNCKYAIINAVMYSAIEKNKRNTIFVMMIFVALVGGLAWLLSYLYFGNDYSSVIFILIIAGIFAFMQYFLSSKLALAVTGAKEISKKDNPRLYRIVENLAITLGLPNPKIYIIEDPALNAFATGRDPKRASVAATTGLLDSLDDDELEAVMAHEMGHVQNYDIRLSMIVFGLVSVIGIMADLLFRLSWGFGRDSDNKNPIVLVLGFVAVILAPIAATLVQLAVSRQREYLADASGCMTTRHPDALISALKKLKEYSRPMRRQSSSTAHLFFANPLSAKSFSKLFSTHPPLEDRIKRLENSQDKF